MLYLHNYTFKNVGGNVRLVPGWTGVDGWNPGGIEPSQCLWSANMAVGS